MKRHIRPIAPLSKGQVSGHVICPFFPWSTVGCIEWEHWSIKWECCRWSKAVNCTVAALSDGAYRQLHFGCWKRATIIEYSRAAVKLSCIDRSAVTKRLGAIALGQGFPTFFWPCTPSAFQQMIMYPFSISQDKHVPLLHLDRWTCTPKFFYDKIFYHD